MKTSKKMNNFRTQQYFLQQPHLVQYNCKDQTVKNEL